MVQGVGEGLVIFGNGKTLGGEDARWLHCSKELSRYQVMEDVTIGS